MTTKTTDTTRNSNNQDYNKLLEIIVCTNCKSKLITIKKNTNKLKCSKCGKEFRIEEGILVMDE